MSAMTSPRSKRGAFEGERIATEYDQACRYRANPNDQQQSSFMEGQARNQQQKTARFLREPAR
jgi:hypothetical protein